MEARMEFLWFAVSTLMFSSAAVHEGPNTRAMRAADMWMKWGFMADHECDSVTENAVGEISL
jgi:hypothetical protein